MCESEAISYHVYEQDETKHNVCHTDDHNNNSNYYYDNR